MKRERCEGFNVYDISEFYGIGYGIYPDAFDANPEKVKKLFKIIENSTLVHMSNKLSWNSMSEVDSPITYGILAELKCPKVYHSLQYLF